MEENRTIQIKRPREIDYVTVARPVPSKGEALLKIGYSGLCGSDIASYTGCQPFTTYPRVPGHEFSAEVVEVNIGDLKSDLRPGMLVTGVPYFNCGTCYSCRKGKKNCCENNQTMGVHRDGSLAEYITMPLNQIVYGRDLSSLELALVEPFAIGYHAVNRGNVRPGDKILIMGAGPIGILTMIAAKLRGARVYMADILENRLALATDLGCDGVINTMSIDLQEAVNEITHGDDMDVCIDAVGISQTFLDCIENVSYGGKLILVGNGVEETSFNHSILVKKELDVFGSRNSLEDFEPIINLIQWCQLDITKLITHIYRFDEAKKAFGTVLDNDGSMGKVLIEFN